MPLDSNTLILATENPGKIRELRELLRDLPFQLTSLHDIKDLAAVEETGSTFRENAEIKARGFAIQARQLSLADDSGLEIEALENAPGVYSARFAGEHTAYDVKISKLLAMLDKTQDAGRRARFVCVMALADKQGRIIHTAEGVCTGSIAYDPKGSNGFGYDPIFMPDGFDRTLGELSNDIKSQISHRAKAARLIIRYLLDFIAV